MDEISIDDITLWSKPNLLYIYSTLLILFYRRTIVKMLGLGQLAGKWTCYRHAGSVVRPLRYPLSYRPDITLSYIFSFCCDSCGDNDSNVY